MLRAVRELIVVTDVAETNVERVEKHFDVTRMNDFNSISDSKEES